MKIFLMSVSEISNSGQNLKISYYHYQSQFGQILIASTTKGICYLGFKNSIIDPLKELIKLFPKAEIIQQKSEIHQKVLEFFAGNTKSSFTLHLKATPFQLEVWKALIKIPSGKLSSYGEIARKINKPKAYRAVGTAVGKNPISFLIPCHRVIQSTGNYGNYHWGKPVKEKIINWEKDQHKV